MRPDRGVLYPAVDGSGRTTRPTTFHAAPDSIVHVVALAHVRLSRRAGIRLALVFHGDDLHEVSAIEVGHNDYQEASITGSSLSPRAVAALIVAAKQAEAIRFAAMARSKPAQMTDAAITLTADVRLARAVERHGPRVLLRLVVAHALRGTLAGATADQNAAAA
jgi:hypothetical protein